MKHLKVSYRTLIGLSIALIVGGCAMPPVAPPPPVWEAVSPDREAEYLPYQEKGTGSLSGQAFLAQKNGGVVKGAGNQVLLDPATSVGNEWWGKAGKRWVFRMLTPPSPGFAKARRTVTADADGKFKFTGLPAGRYFVRTEVTWDVVYIGPQGGLVGQMIDIKEGENSEAILNQMTQ